jgi:hypothetical protein
MIAQDFFPQYEPHRQDLQLRYRFLALEVRQQMLFLIPYLFPEPAFVQRALGGLRLPALEALLARGARTPCAAEGVEAALCGELGIARQSDYPIAPITLEDDGGTAGTDYWLRADPVHLRVMRDRIVLADSGVLEISRQEAEALAQSIAKHYGEAFSPVPLRPERWYVRFSAAPRLRTTPVSNAAGRDISTHLPQGDEAGTFRTLVNELQMLLFEHPVNQAREARGELPINSLWLWGGGRKPVVDRAGVPLYTQDAGARALGKFCQADVHTLPSRMELKPLSMDGVFLLDQLVSAGQYGDAYGWREAILALEGDWFAPLRKSLRRIDPSGVHLTDPVNGTSLLLTRPDAWKFWLRPRPLP